MYSLFCLLSITSLLLIIGLITFVLYRNPYSFTNRSFVLGLVSFVVIETGNVIALFFGPEDVTFALGIRISTVGKALLPFCWFPFSITFARRDYKQILVKWSPLLLVTFAISLFFLLHFLFTPSSFSYIYRNIFFRISSFEYGANIYIIFGLLINLIHLENTFRSAVEGDKERIKYIIVGIGATFVFFIYLSILFVLYRSLHIEVIPINSGVLLLSSALLGFNIVRYRLLDADVFVSRYVVYNSVITLFIGFYLLLIFFIAKGISFFNIPFNYFIISLFAFISLAGLSILLLNTAYRRKFELFINRHFYKHKYEFRNKWMETIKKVCPAESVEDTVNIYIDMVSETMGVKYIYLWHFDKVNNCYICTPRVNHEIKMISIYNKIYSSNPVVLYIKHYLKPFLVKDIQGDENISPEIVQDVKEFARATGTILCVPLISGGEVVGFSFQGEDSSKQKYVKDDFDLLTAISTQAAIQIKKIGLSQDLIEAKEVESFHKLSSFIMHDLKNYTNSLSLISQNAKDNMQNPEFQKDALKTINNTVEKMKDLIAKLSCVPQRFDLAKSTILLHRFIEDLIIETDLYNNKSITCMNRVDYQFSLTGDPNLFKKVIINILNNACDSIEKEGTVEICSDIENDCAVISFSDNGIGMSKEFVDNFLFRPFSTTKDKGFGIGLYQSKSIIEAHKGTIQVDCVPGMGTKFIVKVPKG